MLKSTVRIWSAGDHLSFEKKEEKKEEKEEEEWTREIGEEKEKTELHNKYQK